MDGIRLAALKLYGAAPADRNWILDQFDRPTRRQLRGLLRDLRRSGINSETIGDVDHARIVAERDEPQPTAADSAARLERADPERIVCALSGEPAWVIAAVVNARGWTWREAIAKRLRRKKILKRNFSAASPRPAVVSALLDSLARSLDDASHFERLMQNPRAGEQRFALWARLRKWIG
jgi:hypothetical protein